MRSFFLLLILWSTVTVASAQVELMEKFELGPFGVGFRYEMPVDYSRQYGDTYRPVQMLQWYPTNAKNAKIKYTNYIQLSDLLIQQGKVKLQQLNDYADSLIAVEIDKRNSFNVDPAKYKALTTIAQPTAPLIDGQLPLVILAPGGNTIGQLHSVIAEYLASHGYFVLGLTSLGLQEGEKWPFDQVGLSLQMNDMSFAINHLAMNYPQVDIKKNCLMSWSVGGVSQVLLAMKNAGIATFVSLDSGIGREYGIEMLKESIHFDYSSFNIPYLHLTGNQPEQYKVERSTEFYDSIGSEYKYSAIIQEFAHHHFASQLAFVPNLASANADDEITEAYIDMSELVLQFLDAFVKQENNAIDQFSKTVESYQ